MEYKKKDIDEIIDTNGELIGNNAIPDVDTNADTQAKHTSDYNAKVGTQPFRYDMLGRFGFTLMPFMEGEEKNHGQAELENDLIDLMNKRYIDLISHYYKNPKRIQSDYRKYSTNKEIGEEAMKYSIEWVEKILKIVEKHFTDEFKNLDKNLDEQFKENLVEGNVLEDKMVTKKENEITTKSDDGEVRVKKLEKIAGLINKLEKQDIDKLINLLEKKNG